MMSSFTFPTSLLFSSTYQQSPLCNRYRFHSTCIHKYSYSVCFNHHHSLSCSSVQFHPPNAPRSFVCATLPPQEGVVAVMNFEELVEKNWSFLESDGTNSTEDSKKMDKVISSGNVMETSKVLVSIGSDDFVDRLVDSCSSQLFLLVHDSLLSLACIKERHDKVKCWQGELIHVPEKWTPFDVVFLYFLPALPFKLNEIFEALASRCSPGARVVISHLQGRQALEQQRQQYHDIVVSDLPDKMSLEKVASDRPFVVKEYVDEPSFYMAVLEFKE